MPQEWRLLAEWERSAVDKLLETPFEGRDELRTQLHDCRVRIHDSFGCIEFDIRSGVVAPVERTVPVEAYTQDADGMPVEILLFTKLGKIAELEFNRGDGQPIIELPDPDQWEYVVNDRRPD